MSTTTRSALSSEPGIPDDRPARRRTALLELRSVRTSIQIGMLALFLGVWEGVVAVGWVREFLASRPSAVANDLWSAVVSIFTGGYMLRHVTTTLTEVALGFGLAMLIGITLGVLISEINFVRIALMPFIVAFNSTPRIALAPIFIVWFGFGAASKVVLAAAAATFPILIGTITGLAATERQMLRLMRALGATRTETLLRVRVRTALPYLFAGIEVAIILALTGAVVGEFVGGNAGLGYLIIVAHQSLNLSQMFSVLILLATLGILIYRVTVFVRQKVVFWQGKELDALKMGAAKM